MVRNLSIMELVDSLAQGVEASVEVRLILVLILLLLPSQANALLLGLLFRSSLKTKIHFLFI